MPIMQDAKDSAEQGMSEIPPQQGTPAPQRAEQEVNVPEGEWADRVALAAESMLTDPKRGDQLMSSITRGSPVEALSQTAANMVTSIDDKMNDQIPEDDILPAAIQILESLTEYREAATGETISDEDKQQAALALVKTLAQEYGTTQEQAQAFADEADPDDADAAQQIYGGF